MGTVGEIHFHDGLVMMPGAIWHIDVAAGTADKICVHENLTFTADTTTAPIYINLSSIGPTGSIGSLYGFDPTQTHSWTIAYRYTNLVGFNPAFFNINADAFFLQNPSLVGLGSFSIEQIDQTLALNFTPVPEPGTYALMGLGIALLALVKYRRQRR